jgi:hypothetical protein
MQYAKRDSGTAMTYFLSAARHNSSQTAELTLAAAEVVFRRMTLGGFALVNPAAADHAEFARMVPEKTQAFSDAGSILISRSAQIGQEMGQFIADEMTLTAQTATAVLTSARPRQHDRGPSGCRHLLGFAAGDAGTRDGPACVGSSGCRHGTHSSRCDR